VILPTAFFASTTGRSKRFFHAAKYRKDLKVGGKRRTKAVAKIGAPIAAGAVAGPAGSAGVEAVEHRKWIKHQILRVKPHKSHGA